MDKKTFLINTFLEGFELLAAARLKWSPKRSKSENEPDEMLETAQTWTLSLYRVADWNERDDHARISEAFITIANNDREFPTPARFLEALQSRSIKPATMIGNINISEEQRLINLERIRSIKNALKSMPMPQQTGADYGKARLQEFVRSMNLKGNQNGKAN